MSSPTTDTAAGTSQRYQIAVFSAVDDPHELGEILAQKLGLHPIDAMIHARYVPGILPDLLTEEQARDLASAINSLGTHAEAIPTQDIPSLDHAAVVHHVKCHDEGLEILGLDGTKERLIPWTDVELISMGQVPVETAKHFSVERVSVSAGRHTGHAPMELQLPPSPEVWFVCKNPACCFRIDHKRMNYETLGSRMTDSATANFYVLLTDFVARAKQTYLTPATRAFLDCESAELYSFESAEHLRRYTLLHQLIQQRLPSGKSQ